MAVRTKGEAVQRIEEKKKEQAQQDANGFFISIYGKNREEKEEQESVISNISNL